MIPRPGFADPVHDAQAAFRAVLAAMASPGAVTALPGPPPPPGLHASSAALLLCLADADTPLWLPPGWTEACEWLAFHCGAPFSAIMDRAAFVVAEALPPLDALAAGSDEFPEVSATLLLQIEALGEGAAWRLEGPGLEAAATLHTRGLPDDFAAWWRANHAAYPRGIDLILCAGPRLAALPRSIRVEAG